jgi:hypothetical protein
MPLHNWNHVEAGIFHAFHTAWIGEIQSALNHGLLPADYYALAEQQAGGFVADVLARRIPTEDLAVDAAESPVSGASSGSSVVMELPQTAVHESIEIDMVELRRTIAIRHVSQHKIVALIEIVSPANKDRRTHVGDFVDKTMRCLARGIHVLVVDVLALGKFDPNGMHCLIRDSATEPTGPRVDSPPISATFVSYLAKRIRLEAFVEYPQLGQPLPAMPIYLDLARYVSVPLEATYQRAWEGMPAFWRNVVART